MVKRCPKCGEEKPLTKEFWTVVRGRHKTQKLYWRGICKICEREYERDRMDKSYKSNPDPLRRSHRQWCQKKRDLLYDSYIVEKLKRSNITEITPELIDLKRQQLSMKRTLKQFKTWRKEHESNHADV